MGRKWPQQEHWQNLLEEYRREHNLTNEEVAQRMGIAVSTLITYTYQKNRGPGPKILLKFAETVGCSIAELMLDAPASHLPGDMGEVDEFRFSQMLESMKNPDLTPEDRQILFEDFTAAYERLLILKQRLGKKEK